MKKDFWWEKEYSECIIALTDYKIVFVIKLFLIPLIIFFLIKATKELEDWKDFQRCENDSTSKKEGEDIVEMLCRLLHNISMFENNVPNVRGANCIGAMKPYLESENNIIRLLCLATLADLDKESECGSKSNIIKALMSTIAKVMEIGIDDDCSLKEIARSNYSTSGRNDYNKRLVVEHGAIPLLLKITEDSNIEKQREAVYAIWGLSFDNKTEMIDNKEWKVISTLERLSKSPDKNVKLLSMKTLWTISNYQNRYGEQEDKITASDNRHILISHNWRKQPMVKQIYDGIKKNCISVWMHVHNIQGATVKAMVDAVDQAEIVLVCHSYKFKNSYNCRAETEYAHQTGKKIILLKMESGYEPDGWLEPIIGNNLEFDFSGKDPLEKTVNEVIVAIQQELNRKNGVVVDVTKPTIQSEHEVIIAQRPSNQSSGKSKEIPVLPICLSLSFMLFLLLCLLINLACFNSSNTVCPYKECEPALPKPQPGMSDKTSKVNLTNGIDSAMNWTLSQVDEWLNKKILRKDMFLSTQRQLKTLRGKDIAFLKLLVNECPTTFYQTIREQLGMKDIQSMSDFRFAFEHIDTTVIDTDLHSTTQQFTSTRTVETTKIDLTALQERLTTTYCHGNPGSDMLKQLSKLLIDYRIVEFFCKISAELLESGERFKYPGIKPECIALLSIMLRYLGNCSNNNCELSGIIAREKYFLKRATDKLQEWKCISFGDNIGMKSVEGGNTLELLLSILYNISMVEDNVQNVRDVECIEALKPYLDSKDNTILLLCLATLANLVDETESGILNRKPDVIEFLMSTITKALKCKERMYYGWSLIKLARIVRQVARNDSNKGTVVHHEAVCAVWALSFDNDSRKEMIEKKEWKVIATLERLSKSSDQTVKMVSRNAVWTIKMIKDHRNTCDLQQTVVGGRGERHIVISYNWGHQEVVKRYLKV
ncbi:unnamed protein product [Mytilus edulis]|uniref:TIR domain-containing protein n=1 Tax=Mytilus edulis TaxID=6550 RepID=A0A8S3TU26_MYTED|nr:unnamed protein product [Mytilus edulis]